MENISNVLGECGATLADVVNATVWLAHEDSFGRFNEIYAGYFTEAPPARTTVISGLLAGALVEIAVVALVPQDPRAH